MMLNPTTKFLGKLAGEEVALSGIGGQATYGRIYKAVGSSDALRQKITDQVKEVGEAWKAMGEEYGRTEGGYFRTVKTYDRNDHQKFLTCYAYALGTFGNKLEGLVGAPIEEIQEAVREGDIDPIIEQYFTNVTEPQDGDLVIYSLKPGEVYESPSGGRYRGSMHGGIYRVLQPSEDSPQSECIESKWGVYFIHHVFQHEVFFASTYDGSEVRFYRLKNPIENPRAEISANPFEGRAIKLLGFDDKFTCAKIYAPTDYSDSVRKKIYRLMGGKDYKALGEKYRTRDHLHFRTIKKYNRNDPNRLLTSYAYALDSFHPTLEKTMLTVDKVVFKLIVDAHFTNVTEPQDGDLVVYLTHQRNGAEIRHAGICRVISPTKTCIESKWGGYGRPYVFQHEVFFLPPTDGTTVKFYRLA